MVFNLSIEKFRITHAPLPAPRSSIPAMDSPYHYIPSRAAAIIMLVLFGAGITVHAFQSIRFKLYRLLSPISVFAVLELVGWGFRLASSHKRFNQAFFQLQMSLLILAPTALLAANTVTLNCLVRILGNSTRVNPRLYTIVFVTLDSASAITQMVGGDMAAGSDGSKHIQDLGAKVIIGGVAVQLITTLIYLIVVLSYLRFDVSAAKNSVYYGLGTSLVFQTIRSVTRLIQFSQGWNGKLVKSQLYFSLLDASMIILALYALTISHPGRYLRDLNMARGSSITNVHPDHSPEQNNKFVGLPSYSLVKHHREADTQYALGEFVSDHKKAIDV